jgi:hypothetical protein
MRSRAAGVLFVVLGPNLYRGAARPRGAPHTPINSGAGLP